MAGDVYCVVPTFAPDLAVLDLLSCVSSRSPVLVSDDASPCTSDSVLRLAAAIPGVGVVRHASNAGIGRGLNDGLEAAREANCTWLLTVDQDTSLPPAYVSSLVAAARSLRLSGIPIGALGAGAVNIAGAVMRYPGRFQELGELTFSITEEVMQSGTIWDVSAMTSLGGFNEVLGMDAVDAHACLRLRERGYVVAALPYLGMDHQLGSARSVRIGRDRPVFITGHSPDRRATMVRNRLTLLPDEFRQSPRHALRTLRRVLVNQAVGLMLEDDAWVKARGSLRGLWRSSKR